MNEVCEREEFFPARSDPDSMNFKEYIRYKMKAVRGKNGRATLTAAELADALGMSTKVFHEILNGRRTDVTLSLRSVPSSAWTRTKRTRRFSCFRPCCARCRKPMSGTEPSSAS